MKKIMKYAGITTIALTAIGVAVRAMNGKKLITGVKIKAPKINLDGPLQIT